MVAARKEKGGHKKAQKAQIKKPGARSARLVSNIGLWLELRLTRYLVRYRAGVCCNVPLNHSSDRFFARGAHHALDFFSFAEKNQRRDSFDAVALRSRRIV